MAPRIPRTLAASFVVVVVTGCENKSGATRTILVPPPSAESLLPPPELAVDAAIATVDASVVIVAATAPPEARCFLDVAGEMNCPPPDKGTCNPPPPRLIECPPGIGAGTFLNPERLRRLLAEADAGAKKLCHKVRHVNCVPGRTCNPPPPQAVVCPPGKPPGSFVGDGPDF